MFSLHQGISGRYWSWSRYPIPASPYHWLISPVPRPQTAFYWSRAWAGFCTILWLEASVSRLFSAPGNSWGKNGQLELAPSQPGLWGCQMGARRARLVPGRASLDIEQQSSGWGYLELLSLYPGGLLIRGLACRQSGSGRSRWVLCRFLHVTTNLEFRNALLGQIAWDFLLRQDLA